MTDSFYWNLVQCTLGSDSETWHIGIHVCNMIPNLNAFQIVALYMLQQWNSWRICLVDVIPLVVCLQTATWRTCICASMSNDSVFHGKNKLIAVVSSPMHTATLYRRDHGYSILLIFCESMIFDYTACLQDIPQHTCNIPCAFVLILVYIPLMWSVCLFARLLRHLKRHDCDYMTY